MAYLFYIALQCIAICMGTPGISRDNNGSVVAGSPKFVQIKGDVNESIPRARYQWFCGPTPESRAKSLDTLIEGLVGKTFFYNLESTPDNPAPNKFYSEYFHFRTTSGHNKAEHSYGAIPFLHKVNRCCMDYNLCKVAKKNSTDCGYVYMYCLGDTFENIGNSIHLLGYWIEFYKLTIDAKDHYLILELLNKEKRV
uniref:SCP domain-containing protein n=1 Tax=Strongyloides papillosus TaxID=174720 RepID=A0A0N5CHC0_STREA